MTEYGVVWQILAIAFGWLAGIGLVMLYTQKRIEGMRRLDILREWLICVLALFALPFFAARRLWRMLCKKQ